MSYSTNRFGVAFPVTETQAEPADTATMPRRNETRRSSSLRVQLSFPSGGEFGDRASIRVDDIVSGHMIAEIPLSAAQFMEFMSHTAVRVEASVPDAVGTSRLFRKRVTSTQVVPDEVMGDSVYGQRIRASKWARKISTEQGWDHYEVTKSRLGWRVTFSRWEETTED